MTTPVFLRNNPSTVVPEAFRRGLVLDIFPQAARSTVASNLGVLIERVGRPTQAGVDFLLFSAAIYVADKKAPRRLARDRWTRTFHLSAPVAELGPWTSARPLLVDALAFLTGDHWSLDWRAEQNRLWGADHVGRGAFDAVCLFSGGLDSLTGAIDLLESDRRLRVVLVGHYDSTLTPTVQERLAKALAEQYGHDRVRLIQALVRPAEDRAGQEYPLPVGREATTRSRSLVFLGLGLVVASALGPEAPVYVPENGFIALNVPLTSARLGSCSTRTTHPYFLTQLGAALRHVGLRNPIQNPYSLRTKGEMLAQCRNQSLLERLARQTVSCAHPELGRYERTGYGNCGYCLPCLIRRAALHAVGADDPGDYQRDICTDARLVSGRSARGRDARAVFLALQAPDDSVEATTFAPLLSGPVPEGVPLSALAHVYRQGLDELRSLFRDKASPEVRRIAGI